MGDIVKRPWLPAIIGLAPVALLLLTWPWGERSYSMWLVRQVVLPVLLVEIGTIAIAFRQGMWGAWKRAELPRPAMIAFGVLLFVAIATALFIAPVPYVAMGRTFYWIVHFLFGLSVAHLCRRAMDADELMRWYCIGFVLFAALFALFAVRVWDWDFDWTFDLPAVLHIRHVGIYATAAIGLAAGMMANARSRSEWGWAFAVATVGFAISLWTGSRGPAVSIAGAIIVGALFVPALRHIRAWGGGALSLALGALLVIGIPAPASHMGILRTVASTAGSGSASEVTTGRIELWLQVLEVIGRNPLFGYGEGQMAAVAHFHRMAQPHNLPLQILLAWGLIGLLCIVVLAFYFLRRAIPAVRKPELRLAAPVVAMLALLALSMIDASLYHILPTSMFAACAGIIAARWQTEPGRQ